MKFLLHILTLTVFFLAIKPGVDAFSSHNDGSCCSHSCEVKAEKVEGDMPVGEKDSQDCDDHMCNPFQVCGCCKLFVSPIILPFEKEIIENFSVVEFSSLALLHPQFNSDFWHPPQLS